MSLIFWIIRKFCALSNALDDYFFGPTRAVLNERRRVLELEQQVLDLEDAEEWRQEELDEIEDAEEWIQEQLDEIERRRIQNLTEIETILTSRKELKAMRTVKRRLDLTVSHIRLREFIATTKKFSKQMDVWKTKQFKTKRIKDNYWKRCHLHFDKAWHKLYIDEKRLIAAIYYNVEWKGGIIYHRFDDEEYAWDLFEDPANDFRTMRELTRIDSLWKQELDGEFSIYHRRKRASRAA